MTRRGRWLLGLAIVVGLGPEGPRRGDAAPPVDPPPAAEVDDAEPRESLRWYRCVVGGSPCGRLLETRVSLPDGGDRTTSDLLMRFVRDGTTSSAHVRTVVEADAAGRPRRLRHEQSMGAEPIATEWVFRDEDVVERRRQGSRTAESILPVPPGEWHLASSAFELARTRAVDSEPVVLRVIEPAMGIEPQEMSFRRLGPGVVRLGDGKLLEGVRWEVVDSAGTAMLQVVDDEGELLASRTVLGPGLGDLELVLSDRDSAEAAAEGRLELMESGLVRPVFEGSPRRLDRGTRASFRVGLPEGATLPTDLGGQRVRQIDEPRSALVTFDVGRGSPESGTDLERWLASTAAIDFDDPDVARFARRNDRPGREASVRAEALRGAVHRHVTRKGLSTAFASAGETVRTRRGDCTEHSVLLAAALRSVGIPSRLVSGLVWTDRGGDPRGGFVGHMWTQALVDGAWVDLDASLSQRQPIHPGRLAISQSDGSTRDMDVAGRRLLEVFGALEIEVLEDAPG